MIRRAGAYRWVGIYDVRGDAIEVLAWSGDGAPAHFRFKITEGLNGAAARTGDPVVVGDVTKDPRYITTFGSTRSEMVVPVRSPTGIVVGTIDIESDRPNAFGDHDLELLRGCASALVPLWIR
jgi:GAF domain-containing protein